ncbi:hypothetical protein BCAL_1126 [Bifidobacterium callitrichos DSM 23973]|uniref:Uncharacterized protein n=1 Tax=Bifidobacterium callitrichos DSM 23973 TaxID=1437609 RepID=A0A086ZXZ5_9BIFI|nr:hypothetical protein BCAL_1126 [Bifidobacterium callitrichos DSM 23973]
MAFLPCALTWSSSSGSVPVPTHTFLLPALISPGASACGAFGLVRSAGRAASTCRVRGLACSSASATVSPAAGFPSGYSSHHAPGAGVQARICRSIASTGWVRSMRASSTVILCAYSNSPSGCGVNTAVPSPTLASASTHIGAPSTARRSSSSPEVSRPVRSTLIVAMTGPSSSPSPTLNTSAPVVLSPAQMERCTGAAPRQAGRLEKCRLYQPSGTASSTALGRMLP